MAVRTTAEAVGKIIEVDDTIDLTPFIEVANQLVTDVCSDFEYAAAKLELIERWLSAHFYAIRDMRSADEGAGSVRQSYQYKVDLFLANTMYGQQAMMIDTEGGLRALNDRKGITIGDVSWAGTENWGIDEAEDEE